MIAQINIEYIKTRYWKLYSRFLSYLFFEGRPITTRGQWMNLFVFANYRLGLLLPQLKKVEKPVFIVGTGRSGTTILGIIMSMHKDVAFLNEPKALWNKAYPFEDLIGSYSLESAYYRLNESDVDSNTKQSMHKLFGYYLTTTFSKKVVDKYPELIFRVPFVKAIFPDAKFIFLVRNGWDTCYSIEKWSKRLGKSFEDEVHDWWGRDQRKWNLLKEQVLKSDKYYQAVYSELDDISSYTDMAALEWIATMREGIEMSKRYPDCILTVKYEDLVSLPEKKLVEIASFCELSHDNIFLEYGNKILSSVSSKPPFSLHPTILPLFNDTMEKLGYIENKEVGL